MINKLSSDSNFRDLSIVTNTENNISKRGEYAGAVVKGSSSSLNINELPPEILHLIFEYGNIKDAVNLKNSCRYFHEIFEESRHLARLTQSINMIVMCLNEKRGTRTIKTEIESDFRSSQLYPTFKDYLKDKRFYLATQEVTYAHDDLSSKHVIAHVPLPRTQVEMRNRDNNMFALVARVNMQLLDEQLKSNESLRQDYKKLKHTFGLSIWNDELTDFIKRLSKEKCMELEVTLEPSFKYFVTESIDEFENEIVFTGCLNHYLNNDPSTNYASFVKIEDITDTSETNDQNHG